MSMPEHDEHEPEPEHKPEPEPTPEPVHHGVSREEFDGLKTTIDGLIQKVSEIAPQNPERDEAPTGRPWTHWNGRR